MIHEVSAPEFEVARPLFERFPVDHAWLWPNFNRRLGRVFVDDPHRPRVAVYSALKGISFVAGDATAPAAGELIGRLKELPRAMLFVSVPDQAWRGAMEEFAPWAFVPLARVSFTGLDERKARRVAGWKPGGVAVVRIDAELAAQAMGFDDGVPMIYQSAAGFVRDAVGFGAVANGKLVSLAWTGYPPADDVLIGVRTHADYRGRGLAAFCGAHLACWCLDHHLRPHWNAHASNAASLAAGRKAGFTQAHEHWWMVG